mgnify:CR=1 FL=1
MKPSKQIFHSHAITAVVFTLSESAYVLFFQIYCILQDVQFTEQQRFKQFVSQSKARMEVITSISSMCVDDNMLACNVVI